MNEAGTENSMAASLYPLIRWPQTMAIMAKPTPASIPPTAEGAS